jgi:hypothetical protein
MQIIFDIVSWNSYPPSDALTRGWFLTFPESVCAYA